MTTDDAPRGEPLRCQWADCPEPATHRVDNGTFCKEHAFEDLKLQRTSRVTFTNGIPFADLRRIQAGGGLAKFLEAFDGLYAACWRVAISGDDGTLAAKRVSDALKAANPFVPEV